MLTTYLPAFSPDADDGRPDAAPTAMRFSRFSPEGVVFFSASSIVDWKRIERPIPARFYSAHFAFADGHFAEHVQHDPEFFFHGEEISIAARAFTHGYDLYHPHRLIAWHEYTRAGRSKIWDDHTSDAKARGAVGQHWGERNDASLRRNRALFGIDGAAPVALGRHGLGTARTLAEYEAYAGLHFAQRGVHRDTVDNRPPPVGDVAAAATPDWRDVLKRSNDVRICVHRPRLGDVDAIEAVDISVLDATGTTLHATTIERDALQQQIRGDWLDMRAIFLSALERIPDRYRIELRRPVGEVATRIEQPVDR